LARRRIWLDLLWGAAVPIMCLLLDPLVFRNTLFQDSLSGLSAAESAEPPSSLSGVGWLLDGELRWYALPCYCSFAVQIVLLVVCLMIRRIEGIAAALLAGALFWGGLLATFTMVVVALPATLALFYFGAGLLGFTPVAAAYVYFPRSLHCYTRSQYTLARTPRRLYFSVGLAVAAVLPFAAGLLAVYLRG